MHDLVIRGGSILDGSGGPPVTGDIAIDNGRITQAGGKAGPAARELDADGAWVTPGFVDVHTHYDGQAMWESRLAPSTNHGVTTVVAGNCGVGFAPCRPDQHDMLVQLMEGVEDIPEVVMTSGLPWNWESYPDYLDALGQRQLDCDIASQLPHSALRVFVMGARGAGREAPTADDLAAMRRLTAEAVRAGAFGVTTSRNIIHRTRTGEMAPSLFSEKDELLALAQGLKDAGGGVMQLIPEIFGPPAAELALIRELAATSGRPVSFTLLDTMVSAPDNWRETLAFLDGCAADGLPVRAQVYPRPVGVLYGLDLSFHPFSLNPSFRPLADRRLAEKVAALRDPAFRAHLLAESPVDPNEVFVRQVENARLSYPLGNPPDYEPPLERRLDVQAAREGRNWRDVALDALLADEGRAILYLPGANFRDNGLANARAMLAHERTIVALGDGGAHYGMICDASYPTFLLQRWVRDAAPAERISPETAVAMLSRRPAEALGMTDRGRLAAGLKADINIIDPAAIRLHAPDVVRDLPAGGKRLRQGADGFVATVLSGAVTYTGGVPTGALPGRLVRRQG
jgi:N-acyl-D-amino-acid deacylase